MQENTVIAGEILAAGERVALRRMTFEDCADVIRFRNADRVRMNYIFRTRITLEEEQIYYNDSVASGSVLHLMILEKEKGMRPVGCVVFNDMQTYLQAPDEIAVETGFFIGEDDATGKGYAAEAMALALGYVFEQCGVRRVCARLFTFNLASMKSFLRVGMQVDSFLPDVVCSDKTTGDMYLMSVTRQAFRELCRDSRTLPGRLFPYTARTEVSFVIPCYRSAATLPGVVREIDETMEKAGIPAYEIIMVNDASPDDTWQCIQGLCAEGGRRTGIDFARNFGQHSALMAGIRASSGEIIVCLDDDGQTPPSEATKLIEAVRGGADAAYARYDHKMHSAFRNLGTWLNETMARVMIGKPKDLYVSSYFAMRRFVADEVMRYENSYPYLIGLILRATSNIVNVPVGHKERQSGQSGYNFIRLLALWMNGFTSFSVMPLRFSTWAGSILAVLGFIYGVYTIIKKLVNPAVPAGFSALMCMIVFLGGVIMLILGLTGEYIGRTYITVNRAPQYVIRSRVDADPFAVRGKDECTAGAAETEDLAGTASADDEAADAAAQTAADSEPAGTESKE